MTVSTKKDQKLTEAFLLESERLPSSPLFAELKRQARQVLSDAGLPTIKNEEYKYTGISKRLTDQLPNLGQSAPFADI